MAFSFRCDDKPPPPPVKVSLAVRKAGKTKWHEICTFNDIPLIIRKYAYVPASQGRNEKQIYVRTRGLRVAKG